MIQAKKDVIIIMSCLWAKYVRSVSSQGFTFSLWSKIIRWWTLQCICMYIFLKTSSCLKIQVLLNLSDHLAMRKLNMGKGFTKDLNNRPKLSLFHSRHLPTTPTMINRALKWLCCEGDPGLKKNTWILLAPNKS